MTTYNWQTAGLRQPTDFVLRFISNAALARSPLTRSIHTGVREGEHFELDMNWDGLQGDEREDLVAFFLRLNGPEHRVRFKAEQNNQANRGAFGGAPVVDLANQVGPTIDVRGCTINVTDWIKAGDWFRFDNVLRKATADANSDALGKVTLDFLPKIRTSPADGTSIVTSGPTGIFIMTTPLEYDNRDVLASGKTVSSLSLSFTDAFE